jgi:hypothetical protein
MRFLELRRRLSSAKNAARLTPLITAFSVLTVAFGQTALTTAQIARRVLPSVVVIQGKTVAGDVLGSGFIISKDGKIVTNLHVIRDMTVAKVHVPSRPLSGGGDVFDSVAVLATDETRDLAVVKVAGLDLPALNLGNSADVTVGEPVVIAGSPQGLEGTITAGILSSVRDGGDGFKVLQTDAAVNPGNSGGPLVNNRGQVIGVVSFKLRSAEGLNFAAPISYVRTMLNNLHEPISLEEMRRSLLAVASAREGVGPTLKETLDWLKEKIPLGVIQYVRSINSLQSRNVTDSVTRQATVWSLDSCTAVLGSVETDASEQIGNLVAEERDTVPLGLLTSWSVENRENVSSDLMTFVSGERTGYRVFLSSASTAILSAMSFFKLSTFSES